MSNDFSIKSIQEELLILLERFHSFCMDNGIKYSLHGGTLLGAIRENGFIPWDDDADISLSRDEYNKFVKSYNSSTHPEYIWFDEYEWFIPKLWMQREGKPKVWIDFFIYDYISNHKFVQKIKFFCEDIFLALIKNDFVLENTRQQRSKLIYIPTVIINRIGRIFPQKSKVRIKEYFCANCLCGKKELVHRSSDKHIGRVILLPRSIMDEFEIISFENLTLQISCEYSTILTTSYGSEYMIPIKYDDTMFTGHQMTRG